MNKICNNIIMFVVGAAVGSVVTYKLVKTKYERIAQEEIDSVKSMVHKKFKPETFKPEKFEPEESAKKEYIEHVMNSGYSNYEEEGEAETVERPEVISPDEFDTINYETVFLSYYADKVLADEVDDVVEDIEGTVSSYALTRFGEWEDDVVHVRNHRLRTDYEITIDNRSFYKDIKGFYAADE